MRALPTDLKNISDERCSGVVRKQLGLSFDGQSFPHPLVIGDLEIKGISGNVRGQHLSLSYTC